MFNTINKIFGSLLITIFLVLTNLVIGGWVAALFTAPSWVSIAFGALLGLVTLWLDFMIVVLIAIRITKTKQERSTKTN